MQNARIQSVHEKLLKSRLIVPVTQGGAEERLWLDCDLASLAENRLLDLTDPRELDDSRRADWHSRATSDAPSSIAWRERYERCYWLMDGAERCGTMALSAYHLGMGDIHLSSLYVFPTHRGRGAARQALAQVRAAVASEQCGLRLDTSWLWQRALRFYLDAGMWVYMWKRDLTLFWNDQLPKSHMVVGETDASFEVEREGERVVLARARRRGDVLEMDHPPRELQNDSRLGGDAYWHATTMLSVGIALHGWPLVQSKEEWDAHHLSHGGAPEALAYRIQAWEAWARARGWVVNTPRIAGLEYPSWDDL